MTNLAIAPDVVESTGYFFFPKAPLDQIALNAKHSYAQIQPVAQYLEGMHLSIGDLVADNANKCVPFLVTNVNDPRIRDSQRPRLPAGSGRPADVPRTLSPSGVRCE